MTSPSCGAAIDDEVLAFADWIIPNESEFAVLFGAEPDDAAILRATAELQGQLVGTLGEHGAAFTVDGKVRRVPAPAVTVAVGTVCGSLSTQRQGTQASFPSIDEIGRQRGRPHPRPAVR